MSKSDIPFAFLREQINEHDERRLRSIFRANNWAMPKWDGYISVSLANTASKRLTGRPLTLYKLKQEQRQSLAQLPFEQHNFEGASDRIRQWLHEYLGPATSIDGTAVLGFITAGGYLGTEKSPFPFFLEPGGNILIGERGSGKSTVLSLLAALAPSPIVKTGLYLERIARVLNGSEISSSSLKAAVRKKLLELSIEFLCLFMRVDGRVIAWYTEPETGYCFYGQTDGGVEITNDYFEDIERLPSVHFFQQGEIFRIADDEDQHSLNRLIDELEPGLRQTRAQIAESCSKLLAQHKHTGVGGSHEIDLRGFDQAVGFYVQEFRDLQMSIGKNDGNRIMAEKVQRYLDEYRYGVGKQISILDCFLAPSTNVVAWYIAPIANYLEERLELLSKGGRDARRATAEVLDYLRRRINILAGIPKNVSRLTKFDESLRALLKRFRGVHEEWLELLNVEREVCKRLSRGFLERSIDCKFELRDEELRGSLANAIELADGLAADCLQLQTADIFLALGTFNDLVYRIEDRMLAVQRRIAVVSGLADNPEDLFVPIEVELADKETPALYRPFNQLSFGEKSSIILMTALMSTTAAFVVLDQPEDHLDPVSVVSRIAPAVRSVAARHTTIVASHSANLVLSLGDWRMAIMKAGSNFGQIAAEGSVDDGAMVPRWLSVLEGGVDNFRRKIELFDKFLDSEDGGLSTSEARELDKRLVHRVMDGLRDYQQANVDYRAVLSTLQHELHKLGSSEAADSGLADLQMEIGKGRFASAPFVALLDKLGPVLWDLEAHYRRFNDVLSELTIFDLEPAPEPIPIRESIQDAWHSLPEPHRRNNELILDIPEEWHCINVVFDKTHFALVMKNLFENSLRAISLRRHKSKRTVQADGYLGRLRMSNFELGGRHLSFGYYDNGIGIKPELLPKVYREECSDKGSSRHGAGCLIIRSLLEKNGGRISVLSSRHSVDDGSTVQRIRMVAQDAEDTSP